MIRSHGKQVRTFFSMNRAEKSGILWVQGRSGRMTDRRGARGISEAYAGRALPGNAATRGVRLPSLLFAGSNPACAFRTADWYGAAFCGSAPQGAPLPAFSPPPFGGSGPGPCPRADTARIAVQARDSSSACRTNALKPAAAQGRPWENAPDSFPFYKGGYPYESYHRSGQSARAAVPPRKI